VKVVKTLRGTEGDLGVGRGGRRRREGPVAGQGSDKWRGRGGQVAGKDGRKRVNRKRNERGGDGNARGEMGAVRVRKCTTRVQVRMRPGKESKRDMTGDVDELEQSRKWSKKWKEGNEDDVGRVTRARG
jgi:hypothetical protein